MEMPNELQNKLVLLLEKVGISSDLIDKVKQELQKGGAVSVTKISVSNPSLMVDGKNIDDMSVDELKAALKKIIQKPDIGSLLKDKISNMYM